MEDPAAWTPTFLLSTRRSLTVYCDRCRVGRPVDLAAVCAAGHGETPLRRLRFTCWEGLKPGPWPNGCGYRGVPNVSWWDRGARSYTFQESELLPVAPADLAGGGQR